MTNQPLFSVLIANYNNGKYLMDAIESVRQQTYTNWEIILVDDASTDNSYELYKDLEKDERIHIYYNEQNQGCGYTKHRCAELANGEIAGYLDPDDELLPNALLDTYEALDEDKAIVLALSRFYFCNERMEIVSESRLLDLKGLSYFERKDYQPEVFAAFRISAYRKMGGLDTLLKAAIDQDLFFRLEEMGGIAVINRFTYKYRRNPNALTSRPYWCLYWNLIVRHNACIRRGIPVDSLSFQDFQDVIKCESGFYDEILAKELEVRSSLAYRLGKSLLKPFSWVRRVFGKK